MASLFLTNKFSGKDTVELIQKARRAGTQGVEEWERLGGGGKHLKNAHRDIMRALLKGKDSPEPYWAPIALWNRDADVLETHDMPSLLPHEFFAQVVAKEGVESLQRVNPAVSTLMDQFCDKLGLDKKKFIPLGLHVDGVPCQKWKSIEVISWDFLGSPGSERILAAVMDAGFLCQCGQCSGRHTFDQVLEVLCWSFRCIVMGHYPASRHDKSPWQPHDKCRVPLAGKPLGGHGGLLQFRGDWACIKQIFSFPGWQNKSICWRCAASKEGPNAFTNFGLDGAWRTNRYTERQFWSSFRDQGLVPSPLFRLPGFTLDHITIDVLHALDLGGDS